jgi:hypothetical protein
MKMSLIVGLTGAAGFLASYFMLRSGVTSMALRYPVAIAIAYAAFLILLWLWLRTSAEDYTDFPDVLSSDYFGGASIDGSHHASAVPDDSGVLSEAVGATAQGGEFAVPIFVVITAAVVFLSSMWIVYSAPTLFAELLIDGVLSASLYRRLRGLETQHWLGTAIRRTVWPFAITAIIFFVGGEMMHLYYPHAHSLGEAIRARAENHMSHK